MTNWSSSGGFGGSAGSYYKRAGNTGSGGAGSGLGGDVGSGISPWAGATTGFMDKFPGRQTGGMGSGIGADIGTGIGSAMHDRTTNPYVPDSLAAYFDYYAPEIAQTDLDAARYDAKIGYANTGYALDANSLMSDYGYDQATLANKQAGLGSDYASIAIDLEKLGVSRRQNESDRDYIARVRDLTGQSYKNATDTIGREAGNASRDIKSDYTTAGTLFSAGQQQDQRDNFYNAASSFEAEKIGYDKSIAGLDRDLRNTYFDDERIGLSEKEAGIARQRLDTMSAQLGIDSARLSSNLQSGLAKLGLDRTISVEELLYGATGTNNDKAKMLREILMMAWDAGVPMGDTYGAFLPPSVKMYPHAGGKVV